MTALLIILAAIVLLVIGYMTYGSWLAKEWGVDPTRETPAKTMEDGVDYVAAKPAVLMGHHFSSIAGAGPINGPIQASVFGWLPVFLWCVIGGIFFGGLQDFGTLFASVRHGGKSVGEIIGDTMGPRAKKLFIIFALLVLILVIASFVNVVAGTFMTAADAGQAGFVGNPTSNQTTAIISVLFIILAIIYGMLTNRMGMKTLPATIIGLVGIVVSIAIGLNVGLAMGRTTWIILIGLYITIASLIPVWIMLQPRDYLSSFLLYAMMAVAVCGIIFTAFSGSAHFQLPAFTGFNNEKLGFMFPTLFITVACGACSGFHSLISTGTSSKQLDNEGNAKLIGYGSMLIESALGVISLIAVGMVFDQYVAGEFGSPAVAFAQGIASMFYGNKVIAALLTLAVSVFALTSLDTGTRLSRFMFGELFLKEGEATYKDAAGARKILAHPLFGTAFMVIVGCVLGGLSLSQIWGLFGAANQLLAGLALMAVCAWLGEVGKNNKMFYFPMCFMLVATICSLLLTIKKKFAAIGGGTAAWGDWFQLLFALAMVILAVILVFEAVGVFKKQAAKKA
ncbi:MAG: carbon starvation protein A [Eubacterium sp.]|nr:carbon starvation protein A [Eubacterium sp.]MBQ6363101.1 carbon starvation protein A [Lachnospiraceae bacterium]